MPNLFDYLLWRGDLTFAEASPCEVDNLIFSLLSYVDFDGIVPPPGKGSITLREAAKEYFFTHDPNNPRPLGLVVPAEIITLFRRMADAPRFTSLELSGYVSETCETREMQFAALTVRLSDESLFVAYRGTDDSLVGWREDFNLSYMEEVPSQRKAADYLDALDLPPDVSLWIGGHSKGGNLAVWGAVHACERVRRQICRVYSNDGPGFSEGLIASEAYRTLADRITVLLPDDSLIGLLLEHDEDYAVVKSARRGILQHDGLTWEVLGASFVRTDGLSRRGQRSDTVVRDHISAMTREERQTFVRLLFTALESTGAKTLTDLYRTGLRATTAILRTVAGFSREDQEAGIYLLGKLLFFKESSSDESPNPPKPAEIKAPSPSRALPTAKRKRVYIEIGFRSRHGT